MGGAVAILDDKSIRVGRGIGPRNRARQIGSIGTGEAASAALVFATIVSRSCFYVELWFAARDGALVGIGPGRFGGCYERELGRPRPADRSRWRRVYRSVGRHSAGRCEAAERASSDLRRKVQAGA